MGRKPGPHQLKIELILYTLRAHPQGLWVREISRLSGLKKSTVAHYLKSYLADKIELVHQTSHIKIIRLKPQVVAPDYLQ